MSPSPDLKTEISALRTDAKAWDQAASDMDAPKSTVSTLTLNGANDVMGLGDRMGIDDTYEKARSKAEELMGQATKYFGVLADQLYHIADYYEQQEAAGASDFQQQENEVEGD